MATEPKQPKWIFPTPVKCPRCKGYRTYATHTDGVRGVQYRKCRGSLCRSVKFSIKGVPDPSAAADSPSFDCPRCQATYKRQGDLTKHIKKEHGETNDGSGTQ